LYDPSHINADNLHTVRCETSRHCRNKQWEFWTGKINEPETNSNNKNIIGLSRASMNLRSVIRIKLTQQKDEKGDLFEDSHSIFLSQ